MIGIAWLENSIPPGRNVFAPPIIQGQVALAMAQAVYDIRDPAVSQQSIFVKKVSRHKGRL
jgi:hypothetical protein